MILSTALRRLPRAAPTATKAFASTSADGSNVGWLALAAAAAMAASTATNEKADCTAIAAVVGKDNFDARRVLCFNITNILLCHTLCLLFAVCCGCFFLFVPPSY